MSDPLTQFENTTELASIIKYHGKIKAIYRTEEILRLSDELRADFNSALFMLPRELTGLFHKDGVPPVAEGKDGNFWCLIKTREGKTYWRPMLYLNRYRMDLAECAEPPPPPIAVPADDEGLEYYWTGWMRGYCDHCECNWVWDTVADGEIIGWLPAPQIPT